MRTLSPICGKYAKTILEYWLPAKPGEGRTAWVKRVDEEFMHDSVFMVNKNFGIDSNWAK